MAASTVVRCKTLILLALAAFGGAGVAQLFIHQPSAQADTRPAENVLRATRIELVNAEGKKLVGLAALADGSGGMSVYDAKGEQRINITVNAQGQPSISLFDEQGKPRVAVMIDQKTKQGLLYTDRGTTTVDVPQIPAQAGKPAEKPQVNKPGGEQWKKLKLGMSTADVELILGKPEKTASIRQQGQAVNIWYYPDILGGFAGFGNGRLIRWRDTDGNEVRE
jgi:hypothetical protein